MNLSNTATVTGLFKLRKHAWIVAAVAWNMVLPQLMNGQTVPNGSPLGTLQYFKEKLDAGDLVAVCGVMAEADSSGPLKREHYEQMQSSLDGLAKMWDGVEFYIGVPEVDETAEPDRAVIKARVPRPKQDIKFTLTKLGALWYISDIEVFFK